MKRLVRWSIITLVLLAGVFTVLRAPHPVSANAGPPPNVLWLDFATDDTTLKREGVQLVRCDNATCPQPKLVQQVGVCESPLCVSDTETTDRKTSLVCRANRCLAVYGYGGFAETTFLRLIVQYPDQVRMSNIFTLEGEPYVQYEQHLQVRVSNDALLVDPLPTDSAQPMQWALPWLLTLVVEIAVAAVVLWRLGLVRREMSIMLGLIGLLNLLSFPVVWFFFPALGFFHTTTELLFGTSILLMAVLYGGVIGGIRWIEKPALRVLLVGLSVGVLPLILIMTFVLAVVLDYGYQLPTADGLPAPTILLLSEIFAFIFEAVLIYLASRRTLNIGQATLLSLAMNVASFLAGVLLWPAPEIWV